MNLTIKRDIDNNKFSTIISFASYGSLDITPEDEEALLQDYPVSLTYSDISFTGKYGVANKKVTKDDAAGDTITFVISNKKIPLDANFIAKYEINTNQILDSEIGAKLNTKELICDAKCTLFEDKIQAQIGTLLAAIKAKGNEFESESPINVTI